MRTRSILLAIPDNWILEECRCYLESSGGCEVQTARDERECWSRLQEQMPEALIIDEDLCWGGNDGVVVRLLNQRRLLPMPVLVLADRAGPHTTQNSPYPGGVSFLYRPILIGELTRSLRGVLERDPDSAGVT